MQIVEETRHARALGPPRIHRGVKWPVQSEAAPEETSLVEIAFERTSRSQAIECQASDTFRIEFIVSGACFACREGERFELPPGSVLCSWPGARYQFESTSEETLERFVLDASGGELAALLRSTFGEDLRPRRIVQYRWIHDLFRQIEDALEKGGTRAQRIGTMLFKAMLERIGQLEEEKGVRLDIAALTYERCRACLNTHFKGLSGIGELAEKCNVSAAYLSRLFKRYANSTPSQLLLQRKMNHAAELLLAESLMVKEVAGSVGYDDPYYFSRSFKQFFGVSPKRFAFEASGR